MYIIWYDTDTGTVRLQMPQHEVVKQNWITKSKNFGSLRDDRERLLTVEREDRVPVPEVSRKYQRPRFWAEVMRMVAFLCPKAEAIAKTAILSHLRHRNIET